MTKKLLVANWKLNPQAETEAVRLARAVDRKGVVICPPFPFLGALGRSLRRAVAGAQDVFWEERGAYTGEISALMLKKIGVKYVIIGHSERRRHLCETDEMINKKVLAALKAGLKVILCVGEPLAVRRRGLQAAKNFVKNQLRKDLQSLNPKSYLLNSLIVAYEPVWAIGTGKPDKPEDAAEMARFIKMILKRRKSTVLYGGSVTSKNIGRIMHYNEIDGALVGSASLHAKEFRKIINIISHGYK